MRDLVFEFPQAGYLLVIFFAIIGLQLFLHYDRLRRVQTYAVPHLLASLLIPRSNLISFAKTGAWGAVWILACFALMTPEGNIRYLPTTNLSLGNAEAAKNTHQVIFLVDTSSSMTVSDGSNGQTRLSEAKEIMQNVMSQLKGSSVAVDAFTSVLTPVVPPTLDYLFTRLMIKELHANEGDVGGTDFKPVLVGFKNKVLADSTAYTSTVFLLSDGGDNEMYAGKQPSNEALDSILNDLPNPDTFHLKMYTIGLGRPTPSLIPRVTTADGKPVSSQLQPELLEKLAERGKGQYFAAYQWNHWELAEKLMQVIKQAQEENRLEATHLKREVAPIKQDEKIADLYYQIPLGLAILLLLAGLILPDTRFKTDHLIE